MSAPPPRSSGTPARRACKSTLGVPPLEQVGLLLLDGDELLEGLARAVDGVVRLEPHAGDLVGLGLELLDAVLVVRRLARRVERPPVLVPLLRRLQFRLDAQNWEQRVKSELEASK